MIWPIAPNELRFRDTNLLTVSAQHDKRHVTNEVVFNMANTKPALLD